MHTGGLIARWYISGHAPWSNAYESIVYVSWATMFFGLAFDIKSKLTVASSAFVTAMILMAAYMNWIDPEIANLQPVLNSWWLLVHVSIIVVVNLFYQRKEQGQNGFEHSGNHLYQRNGIDYWIDYVNHWKLPWRTMG